MTDKTHDYIKQMHERSRVNCMEKSERSSGVSFLLFSLKRGDYYVIADFSIMANGNASIYYIILI